MKEKQFSKCKQNRNAMLKSINIVVQCCHLSLLAANRCVVCLSSRAHCKLINALQVANRKQCPKPVLEFRNESGKNQGKNEE